jgi:hypothetical protein
MCKERLLKLCALRIELHIFFLLILERKCVSLVFLIQNIEN